MSTCDRSSCRCAGRRPAATIQCEAEYAQSEGEDAGGWLEYVRACWPVLVVAAVIVIAMGART